MVPLEEAGLQLVDQELNSNKVPPPVQSLRISPTGRFAAGSDSVDGPNEACENRIHRDEHSGPRGPVSIPARRSGRELDRRRIVERRSTRIWDQVPIVSASWLATMTEYGTRTAARSPSPFVRPFIRPTYSSPHAAWRSSGSAGWATACGSGRCGQVSIGASRSALRNGPGLRETHSRPSGFISARAVHVVRITARRLNRAPPIESGWSHGKVIGRADAVRGFESGDNPDA